MSRVRSHDLNTCENCWKPFHPFQRNQRFCCTPCRVEAMSHSKVRTKVPRPKFTTEALQEVMAHFGLSGKIGSPA